MLLPNRSEDLTPTGSEDVPLKKGEDPIPMKTAKMAPADTPVPPAFSAVNARFNRPEEYMFTSKHDGVVHNPLGAAAYIFEKEQTKPLLRYVGVIPQYASFSVPPISPGSGAIANVDVDQTRTSQIDHVTKLPSKDNSRGPRRSGVHRADSGVALDEATSSATTVIIHIGAQPNNSPHAGHRGHWAPMQSAKGWKHSGGIAHVSRLFAFSKSEGKFEMFLHIMRAAKRVKHSK